MEWQGWPHDETMSRQLLLFEAFVSGKQPHIDAAESAVQELNKRLKTGNPIKSDVAVGEGDEISNILGAMMMRTGWAKGTDVLKQSCLVIKPSPQKETLGSENSGRRRPATGQGKSMEQVKAEMERDGLIVQ